MPLELKFDEEGKVVFVDKEGVKLPVYVDEDGKDLEVDVSGLFTRITEVSAEAKGYRKEKGALKEKFKLFDGIENLEEWKEDVEKAVETVKNFDDKKLVDAGKVEEIKKQIKDVHVEEIANIHKSYEQSGVEKDQIIKGKDDTIYKLMVSSKFAQSPFFSGESPKSTLPPEIAETYFGKNYKVEDNGKGVLRTTGYKNDGTPIYSRQNPGELAEFDEALEVIINEYPYRDRILRSSGAGSGAGGGSGAAAETGVDAQIAKLQSLWQEAMDNKDAKRALALKNQIFDLNTKKNLGLLK